VGSNALSEVGPLHNTGSEGKPPRPRQGRPEWAGEGGGGRMSVRSKEARCVSRTRRNSSLSEKPVHRRVRRLAEWLNPTNAKKVHSLVDKVYQRKNLERAWERVRANRGSGGVDGQTLEEFAWQLNEQLDRLHSELKQNIYQPQPVRQVPIPKLGKPGEFRLLGIPTIYDRVCQQALLNRLEPIFEPVFEEANFGYRRGRSTKDALRKVWREIHSGRVWIVDADLKDFFDHSSGCSCEKRNCWRMPHCSCSNCVRVAGVSGNKYSLVLASRLMPIVPL
jgi:hypothetical protein